MTNGEAIIAQQIAEIDRLRAQLASARKALDLAEYVSRKDSLTEHERLSSVRTVVCAAISALTDEEGEVSPASYCALCDLEHQLHEDAQGFHHVVKGERVACASAYREGE